MLYFNSFPKVITTDYKNNSIVLTNLMVRTEIIPSLLKNPLIFYSYDMKDSDRPDIIANKYYNDVNKFWLVLYSNQVMDPEYDLALNSQKFNAYLKAKYPTTDITNTIKEYRKTITTYDASSLTTTSKTIVIDATTYNNTITGTTTNNFYDSHGNIINSVTQTITLQAITIYQYEIEQNEAKRNIDLINASYSNQIEKDFVSLMRI
jgi:hypothetical protein